MAGEDVLIRFRADISGLVNEVGEIIAIFNQLSKAFERIGETAAQRKAETFGKTLKNDAESAAKSVDQLLGRLDALLALQKQIEKVSLLRPFRTPIGEVPSGFPGFGGIQPGTRVTGEAVSTAIEETKLEILRRQAEMKALIAKHEGEGLALARQKEAVYEELLASSGRRRIVEEQIKRVLSGQLGENIVANRLRELERVEASIERTRAQIEQDALAQIGKRGTRLQDQRIQLENRLASVVERRLGLDRQLEQAATKAADAQGQGLVAATRAQAALAVIQERRNRAVREEQQLLARLGRIGGPTETLTELLRRTGGADLIARLDAQMADVQRGQIETLTGGIRAVAPEYQKLFAQLARQQEILDRGIGTEENRARLMERQLETIRKINTVQRQAPSRGLPEVLSVEDMRQGLIAGLPGLERLLVGAFDDIGRRFQATLQFAVSGALIFGVQQFFRTFLENAIEVERTFADIESALEFDLDDEGLARGSRAFRVEVENLRREIVFLARDFNVLPSLANEVAFKMVARFRDSGNAIKAARAQLLATRVSTIDADETLRALTATAEGFAEQVLASNDALSLQQRLLEHERRSVENYAKALDDAVLIQQRFGVEVEDTLEGTARAAQTFSQLGFTMQETEATVAALSFTLGQTGANVAERLNRAFGTIASPEIRDQLLEVAAASEVLNLSFADFDTGADAIRKINAQISDLERLEPGTLLRLRDILGQRRETETVAAFFGTADLRAAIEGSLGAAAGAAERRFGFLAVTISERLASINGGFQELAQNFERLGGLNPFKTFLIGADLALGTLNNMLLAVGRFVEFLDRVGEIASTPFAEAFDAEPIENFGTRLRDIVGTLISVAAIVTTIRSGVAAMNILRAGALRAAGGPIKSTEGFIPIRTPLENRAAMGAIETAAFNLLNFSIIAKLSAREQQSLAKGVAVASKELAKSMLQAAAASYQFVLSGIARIPKIGPMLVRLDDAGKATLTTWGKVAGIAGLLIAGFLSVAEGAKKAAEGMIQFSRISERSEIAAQRQELQGPFETLLEREAFRAEQELNDLIAQSQTNVRGGISTALAQIFPVLDEQMREEFGVLPALFRSVIKSLAPGTQGLVGDVESDLIPFSEQWWEAQLEAGKRAFLESQIKVLGEDVRQAAALTGESIRPGSTAGGILSRAASLAQQASEAETDEEFEAASVALELLQLAAERFFRQAGTSIGGIEIAVGAIETRLRQITDELRFGEITPAEAQGEIAGFRDKLQQHIDFLKERIAGGRVDLQDELDRAIAAMRNLMDTDLSIITSRFAEFQRAIDRGPNEFLNLNRTIQNLQAEIRALQARGVRSDNERMVQLREQLADAYAEQAQLTRERRIDIARTNVEMARTFNEWLEAMEELQRVLFGASIEAALAGDPDLARDLDQERIRAAREVIDTQFDQARRQAVASARLAAPIRSNLARINADIIGLRFALRDPKLSPADVIEIRLQIAEELANQAEEEANRVAARARLAAGINDRLASLTTEVAILVRQMELIARLSGTDSAEFADIQLRIEQAKAEVAEALVTIADLQRRLGSDLSDDFEQAILDLHLIADKLQAPNLGELERAQLELEKRQGELAAARAFFNEELFNLRFLFETGEIGTSNYLAALRALLAQVDTSTQQGKEIFLEIQALIDSMTEQVGDMQFNVPTSIRLPTLFEVRRALAADQMGLNYVDNREQEVNIIVSGTADIEAVVEAVVAAVGQHVSVNASRYTTGGAGIVLNGFT